MLTKCNEKKECAQTIQTLEKEQNNEKKKQIDYQYMNSLRYTVHHNFVYYLRILFISYYFG
jgi:hypothetical protein